MKHMIISHPNQEPATDSHDPESASTAIEIFIPGSLSEKAQRVIEYFGTEACLYMYKGQFVLTDEALDLGEPRWAGKSIDELEAWLEATCDEYDANYAKYPGWDSINDPTKWDWGDKSPEAKDAAQVPV